MKKLLLLITILCIFGCDAEDESHTVLEGESGDACYDCPDAAIVGVLVCEEQEVDGIDTYVCYCACS